MRGSTIESASGSAVTSPSVMRSSGMRPTPSAIIALGVKRETCCAEHGDAAFARRERARDDAGQRLLAVAGDAGDADDLAAAHGKAGALAAACRHGPMSRRRRAPARRRPWSRPARTGGTISWPHISRAISADDGRAGVVDLAGDAAVAQHHAAMRQRAHLVQLVRDEDDAEALAPPWRAAPRTGRRPRPASAPPSARRGSGCARRGTAP